MNKALNFFIIAGLLVIILVAAFVGYDYLVASRPESDNLATYAPVTDEGSDKSGNPEDPVNPAPDFTVYNADGTAHKLSDFQGKPVVLNFWASWCGPCKSEMPAFDALCKEYSGQIQFLMVNLTDGSQETVETASAFIDQAGYTFPVYYDTHQDAAATYGVTTIPATYFIDAHGNLIAVGNGALSEDTLRKGIGMITE